MIEFFFGPGQFDQNGNGSGHDVVGGRQLNGFIIRVFLEQVYPESGRRFELFKMLPIAKIVPEIIVPEKTAVDSGLSKGEAVGPALQGSDDVGLFERVWADIKAQAEAARAINPAKYAGSHEFSTAMIAVASDLDAVKYCNGILAVNDGKWPKEAVSAESL